VFVICRFCFDLYCPPLKVTVLFVDDTGGPSSTLSRGLMFHCTVESVCHCIEAMDQSASFSGPRTNCVIAFVVDFS